MPARKAIIDTTPGPWVEWRTKSRAERCIRFIETYCRTTRGHGAGELIRLRRFQKAWLRRALRGGVIAAILSIARGNGKSTLLAGVAVWALFDPDEEGGAPQVPIIATTVGQAMKTVYGPAVDMIQAEPELARRALVYTAIGQTETRVPATGGVMFPVADKEATLQGLDPSVAIVDEIGFTNLATWQSVLMATGKRPRSLVVGIGTFGPDSTSDDNALGHLHRLADAGSLPAGVDYSVFTAPDGCSITDPKAWKAANPGMAEGLLDLDAIETAAAMSTEASVRLYRLNQYGVEGIDGWLGDDGRRMWDALARPELRLAAGVPTWVGIDIGLKRDSSAVVAVQYTRAGELFARARLWEPTEQAEVDEGDVMAYLRELDSGLDVVEHAYDPRLFSYPGKLLTDEGLRMVEFPQSVERMSPAVGDTFERIVGGSILHDGDPKFRAHVLNAVPRLNERGFTLAKGRSKGRIDAAVALCIAVDRALRSPPKRRHRLIIG